MHMYRDSSEASLASVNHWLEFGSRDGMVYELYDVLFDVGFSTLAKRKFRYEMMPDAASGFLEKPFAQMYVLESAPISSDVIDVVADVGRDKWREIGRALRFSQEDLADYDHNHRTLKEKLYGIVSDWTRKNSNPTLRQLLEVCGKVEIKGLVTRK